MFVCAACFKIGDIYLFIRQHCIGAFIIERERERESALTYLTLLCEFDDATKYLHYIFECVVCAYQSVQKAAMANSALTKVSETWCKGQP